MATFVEKVDVQQIVEPHVRDQEYLSATLEWANMIRGEYDLKPLDELPLGVPGSTYSCVLAQAVVGIADSSCPLPESEGRHAGNGLVYSRDGLVQQRYIPDEVQEFMVRFDAGVYPELIRDSIGVFVSSIA